VAWSMRKPVPLVRIPDRRGIGTRCGCECPTLRQPHLALAVQLAAGWTASSAKLTPPDPVNKNIFEMSFRERRKYRIDELPRDPPRSRWTCSRRTTWSVTPWAHTSTSGFVEAKREEWQEYIGRVSEWRGTLPGPVLNVAPSSLPPQSGPLPLLA